MKNETIFFETVMDHPIDSKLEIIFKAYSEPIDFRDGNFELQEDIDLITSQLDKGIDSAWFTARVTVRLKGSPLEASEYLGCCSYKSFEDFIESGDYFSDMVKTATSDLKESINKLNKILSEYLK